MTSRRQTLPEASIPATAWRIVQDPLDLLKVVEALALALALLSLIAMQG